MSNRSVITKYEGAVDGTSGYNEIARLLNRKHRRGTFRCINRTSGSVTFRVRIADDDLEWTYYGASTTVVPGGVDEITTEWKDDNVILEATGAVAGQVAIEEISPVEAYNTLGD